MTLVKFALVLFLFVKAVTTSCVSKNAVNTLNSAKRQFKNIEKYLEKCDHDSLLEEPMVSIARRVKQTTEGI